MKGIGKGSDPTLSAHASVVHESDPLQPVVARAQDLLNETKARGGRDAFSVLAAVHSGVASMVVAPWEQLPSLTEVVRLLSSWRPDDVPPSGEGVTPPDLKARRQNRMAARMPHQLLDGLAPFFTPQGSCVALEGLRLEADRLISRSVTSSRVGTVRSEGLLEWVCKRADPETTWLRDRHPEGPALHGAEALSSALEVSAFLARQLDWQEVARVAGSLVFEPLDVLAAADARPLVDGGWGYDGESRPSCLRRCASHPHPQAGRAPLRWGSALRGGQAEPREWHRNGR